jgi:tetratricopeptide (TPR) repeat protein
MEPARSLQLPHFVLNSRTATSPLATASGSCSPAAEPLLVYAALLAPEPIPLLLFTEAREKFGEPMASMLDGERLDEIVALLRTFSLINRESLADEFDPTDTTDTIRLHRLVRQVAAARREGEARDEALRVLLEAMTVVCAEPYRSGHGRRLLDALALALIGCDRELTDEDWKWHDHLLSALKYSDHHSFVPLYERALASCSMIPQVAWKPAADLCNTLAEDDRPGPTWPMCARALAICEKALGPEHPCTARSLNNLACSSSYKYSANTDTVKPLYERALAIYEKTLGPEHLDTAMVLMNLADRAMERAAYTRALKIYSNTLGPGHLHTAAGLNHVALLLKVRPGSPSAMDIFHKVAGHDDLQTAAGLKKLSLKLAWESEAVLPVYERTLAIYEKVLGPDHVETATALMELAFALEGIDKARARHLYERALAIREKMLCAGHLDTVRTLLNLGWMLRDADPAAAQPFYERALAICEKVHGAEHPDALVSRRELGRGLERQGDLSGARSLFERALAIRETSGSLTDLARVLKAQGDLAGARPLYERALAISEGKYGPEELGMVYFLSLLAGVIKAQGDRAGARPLYERALAISEKDYRRGKSGRDVEHARLLLDNDRAAEALIVAQTYLAKNAQWPNYSGTRDSAHVTADALDALGRTDEAKALREKYGVTEPEKPEPSSAST